MDKDFILDIYYSTKGNLDEINTAIEARLEKSSQARKISFIGNFIKTRLAANPKVLKMPNMEINSLEAIYLGCYPGVENVEVLDLRQNHIGDQGLEGICQSPALINLREMDLRNNQITRAGMQKLLAATHMSRLEKLDLRLNKLGGELWRKRLKESGNFPELSDLRVGGGG